MDKYEYKSKTERMLELMESGAYSRAAAIADEIDWRRVRNAVMLSNVSEIYEKTGEYQKGYDILTLAYQRAEGSRKIISRLCGLALKTGNVDEAIDFYDEFMQIAPKDPNQYILRYKILRAQRAPIEQQIEALEEYKKSEYIEEWAYELAKLYQEAGMTSECLEECDDLILWFSEGQYVYKAMELKMQYKPLTPSQQEKYDKRYARTSEETEEIPDIFSYAEADESEQEEEENGLPGAELMAADSEVADADFAAEQQVNARVPKGMEELVPDMMPETISEGVREITLPNDPVEVDTEAWEADEIKALEADSPAEDAEDHVEQDEQVPIDAEDAGQTEDAYLPTDVSEAEGVDEPEERVPEGIKGPDVLETTAEPEEDYYEESEEVIEEPEEDYYEESEEVIEEPEEDYYEESEEVIEEPEEDYYEESEEVIEEPEEDYYEEADEVIEEAEGNADDEYFFGEDDAEEIQDIEDEFTVNPDYSGEDDDREIPDDDEPIDIMSATTPLSRKETAKLIATGKTAPLPLDEISDALSMDTGFVVHGRYDLEMQSGIGTRAGLTEEQKKLFSYFVPVRGMSEQLVDVLEQDKNCTNRKGTSRTGNLLIIGNKGNGKTVLAVDVVKAIQKQRDIRQGKVAIVTGDSLNKKKISDIVEKLYGGALIIEKASKMNEKTVARLNKAMEQDTGEMLIVLEEQRKPLDRLLSSNREFRKKFTSRLEVPIFINDELVTFGQTYAKENGYHIDEMGILALYSKIDSLQREDHFVTVAEVKEVMDDAIRHSQKASAKKLMRKVFGRNTDESDRIILSEKDFNI